jgi:hypothetical protein
VSDDLRDWWNMEILRLIKLQIMEWYNYFTLPQLNIAVAANYNAIGGISFPTHAKRLLGDRNPTVSGFYECFSATRTSASSRITTTMPLSSNSSHEGLIAKTRHKIPPIINWRMGRTECLSDLFGYDGDKFTGIYIHKQSKVFVSPSEYIKLEQPVFTIWWKLNNEGVAVSRILDLTSLTKAKTQAEIIYKAWKYRKDIVTYRVKC